MAIGMGECREKVRAQMIEVSARFDWGEKGERERTWANGDIENDSTCWEAAGGSRLRGSRESGNFVVS